MGLFEGYKSGNIFDYIDKLKCTIKSLKDSLSNCSNSEIITLIVNDVIFYSLENITTFNLIIKDLEGNIVDIISTDENTVFIDDSCPNAELQIFLGDVLIDTIFIESGDTYELNLENYLPECEPPTVIWDGDSDYPLETLDCGETLDINCETLINGVVVEIEGNETFIEYFRVQSGFPVYSLEGVGSVGYSVNSWAININQLPDPIFSEEGTELFPWLATWGEGITVRQATISDACCECEPPEPCPTLCEQINESNWETVKACMSEGQIENAEDDLCNCPPSIVQGALPIKTFQTTSQGTGSDGDTQIGSGATHTTLPYNNLHGNTDRFLDTLGTAVFADSILCDWLSWDSRVGTILQVYFGSDVLGVNRNFDEGRDYCNTIVAGGFSDWVMINESQLHFLMNQDTSFGDLNFAPLNIGALNVGTSTAYATTRVSRGTGGALVATAKTTNTRTLAVRIANVSLVGSTIVYT
jgi:hypothetical protein